MDLKKQQGAEDELDKLLRDTISRDPPRFNFTVEPSYPPQYPGEPFMWLTAQGAVASEAHVLQFQQHQLAIFIFGELQYKDEATGIHRTRYCAFKSRGAES